MALSPYDRSELEELKSMAEAGWQGQMALWKIARHRLLLPGAGLGAVVSFITALFGFAEVPMLIATILLMGTCHLLSRIEPRQRLLGRAESLLAAMSPDTCDLPHQLVNDYWGQQLLTTTKLQNRKPWTVEIALWMALFSLASEKIKDG